MRAAVWTTTLLAAGLCLAGVVVAGAVGPVRMSPDSPLDRLRFGDTGVTSQPEGSPAEEDVVEAVEPPEPVLGIPLEVVLGLLVVVVGTALLARALLRAGAEPAPVGEGATDETVDATDPGIDLRAVAEAARRGVLRLSDVPEGQARDAVVACWVELETAGHGIGTDRRPTDTPTEFADRLARAVPSLSLARLTVLRLTYSAARYGADEPTTTDVATARRALVDLLAAIDLPATAGPGAFR